MAADWHRVYVTLPPSKHDEFRKLADDRGLAVAAYMRQVLLGHLRDRQSNIPPIMTGTSTL